ncbi:protein NEDD1 isoform X1 [Cygnus olor]|uniref:protein NEDD1 isoform X1 n=1 Tax=Cygnus olor TaxID=8869 RepID=UPI001ADE8732|nr:protein NEDD1 isoform X1 [Cygnus olor]XP_040412537.1 protein NEDD1 isoform X1 [Cygnus olor]XP_040412541.1 protein NEDD1 isoform X1 [Cygnus olor]XP_040412551.1 protein NEDD1 isoform X1 [Cygnus olor]XP_040412556.1 protein NEDD1 isoform X1 [Cygnus olor]XP_040412564.1 protein NEDD1 isoform X1 [Cygnus olor]XP_040412567.1 protein NEDD1 isoform X1 [Cygnus olor]XP_040412573.1 protein NEDD1 isoform X1 [Cygnus olor]
MQEGVRFASAGDDVKIWDSSSLTVVEQFNPHTAPHLVSSLCWASNNSFLVTASAVGDKIVVSSCKSKPVPLFEIAEGAKQTCVSLNSSSLYIASGGLDNTVNIWDLKSRRVHRSLKDHKDEVTCVTYNWNDCYIASGSLSGEIILHSVTTNLSSTPFGYGSRQPVRHLKYSSFKKSLLGSVSDSGNVTLWDVNSQNPYHNFENTHKAPASEICFSPVNELLLVTVGLDKRIILYDTSSKKLLTTIVADFPLTTVDFMPDGTTLAIGCSRGKICQYDLRKLTSPVKTVAAHKGCVKCIRLQFSSTFSKSNLKGSSNKPVSKRIEVKAGSNLGANQNIGIKNLASQTSATVSSPLTAPNENKGGEFLQEKTGFPRSCSLDVIPSKETDHGKSADLNNFDDLGRNSLGDVFSPVRDDIIACKANEDPSGKGDGLDFQSYLSGLDFLPQLTTAFPVKRNPVGSNAQGIRSSPLHALVGSPIKEEEEHPETDSKKTNLGKQESKESLKQLSKLNSASAESGTLSPPPPSTASKTAETNERLVKNTQAHLAYDLPLNGTTSTSPKITSPVTAGVASSLSEKIVETIGSSRLNAPLTSIQINFIQNMIQETMDDFREACHRDIVNLQVEMIKQFHVQLNEMHALLERYSVNESLVAEIERLREENKRLRTHF